MMATTEAALCGNARPRLRSLRSFGVA